MIRWTLNPNEIELYDFISVPVYRKVKVKTRKHKNGWRYSNQVHYYKNTFVLKVEMEHWRARQRTWRLTDEQLIDEIKLFNKGLTKGDIKGKPN